MKQALIAIMLLVLVLCSCQKPQQNQQNNTDTQNSPPPSQNVTTESDQTRITYYENLVKDLQREILTLKSDLYAERVRYAALLAETENRDNSNISTSTTETQKYQDFLYRIENGAVTVLSYTGMQAQVTIPATIDGKPVRVLGDSAFAGNTQLVSVTLPDGICEIGWFAFSGCVGLEQVALPASVTTIAYGAFDNCSASMTISCPIESYAEQYAHSYGIKIKQQK